MAKAKRKKGKAKSTDAELHESAAKLGHAGGIVGGPARANALTEQERHDIAKAAAEVRWAKEKVKKGATNVKHKKKRGK